jgi:hypothetical protein
MTDGSQLPNRPANPSFLVVFSRHTRRPRRSMVCGDIGPLIISLGQQLIISSFVSLDKTDDNPTMRGSSSTSVPVNPPSVSEQFSDCLP